MDYRPVAQERKEFLVEKKEEPKTEETKKAADELNENFHPSPILRVRKSSLIEP
jgi:hypothetical protein